MDGFPPLPPSPPQDQYLEDIVDNLAEVTTTTLPNLHGKIKPDRDRGRPRESSLDRPPAVPPHRGPSINTLKTRFVKSSSEQSFEVIDQFHLNHSLFKSDPWTPALANRIATTTYTPHPTIPVLATLQRQPAITRPSDRIPDDATCPEHFQREPRKAHARNVACRHPAVFRKRQFLPEGRSNGQSLCLMMCIVFVCVDVISHERRIEELQIYPEILCCRPAVELLHGHRWV